MCAKTLARWLPDARNPSFGSKGSQCGHHFLQSEVGSLMVFLGGGKSIWGFFAMLRLQEAPVPGRGASPPPPKPRTPREAKRLRGPPAQSSPLGHGPEVILWHATSQYLARRRGPFFSFAPEDVEWSSLENRSKEWHISLLLLC